VFMVPEPSALVLALLAPALLCARLGRKGAIPCSDGLRRGGSWPSRAARS
jgi:hypothetical protein